MTSAGKNPQALFHQPTTSTIAENLRALRKSKGLTLADVEKLSRGSIRAVALGSYERCDRALSIDRLIHLANFFNVPVTKLLSLPSEPQPPMSESSLVIDLRKAAHSDFTLRANSQLFTIFFAWIAGKREDWNGEVMSLRSGDLTILGLITFWNENKVFTYLKESGIIIEALNRS